MSCLDMSVRCFGAEVRLDLGVVESSCESSVDDDGHASKKMFCKSGRELESKVTGESLLGFTAYMYAACEITKVW